MLYTLTKLRHLKIEMTIGLFGHALTTLKQEANDISSYYYFYLTHLPSTGMCTVLCCAFRTTESNTTVPPKSKYVLNLQPSG